MKLGMVGLGRMGGNMMHRLRDKGHTVIGYDVNPEHSDVATLGDLVAELKKDGGRAVVWVMVPAGDPTRATIAELREHLGADDVVIDGGNSNFNDDQKNAEFLAEKGVKYLDCGVSGGVWGLQNGYGLMVGGCEDVVEYCMPIFDALRPDGPREEGFSYVGPVGAGHYAKMIHNGIEYGLMQAYAEGYELLAARDDLIKDPARVVEGWKRGTVVRSWLLDLFVEALREDSNLEKIEGYVNDSGEGRWTVFEAINNSVPAPVIAASLFARFSSRQDDSPAMKAVAALRNQFGGHAVVKAQ